MLLLEITSQPIQELSFQFHASQYRDYFWTIGCCIVNRIGIDVSNHIKLPRTLVCLAALHYASLAIWPAPGTVVHRDWECFSQSSGSFGMRTDAILVLLAVTLTMN